QPEKCPRGARLSSQDPAVAANIKGSWRFWRDARELPRLGGAVDAELPAQHHRGGQFAVLLVAWISGVSPRPVFYELPRAHGRRLPARVARSSLTIQKHVVGRFCRVV